MALETFTMDGVVDAPVSSPNGIPVGTGAQTRYSDTDKAVGTTAVICTSVSGQVAAVGSTFVTPSKIGGIDVFLRTLEALPAAGQTSALGTGRHLNTSGTVFQIEWTAAGAISFFANAGSSRTAVSGVTITTPATWFRAQVLFNINGSGGTAPNDSDATIKIFSGTSPFTTQLGTTLTLHNINLGTNPVALFWGGTLANGPHTGGVDNLRWDSGRTTDFTAPPAASQPIAVIGVGAGQQDAEEDSVINFNYTGSSAGSGTINLWELTCIEAPLGATIPAIQNPATATPTSTPSTWGQYKYQARVRNSSGIWSDPVVITLYIHAKTNVLVRARRIIQLGGWTVGGTGAASALDVLRNPSPTGAYWLESPANPDPTTDILVFELDPLGPGPIEGHPTMFFQDTAQDGHAAFYLVNTTTLVQQADYDLTTTPTQYDLIPDSTDLTTLTTAQRRGIIVKIWGGPA